MEKIGSITIGTMALSSIFSAILTFLVCIIAMKVLMKLVDKVLAKATKLDGTLVGFIRSAARILLWILTVIIVAGALGIPTSSMVAIISIAGLALPFPYRIFFPTCSRASRCWLPSRSARVTMSR